jgi:hypothetical protein
MIPCVWIFTKLEEQKFTFVFFKVLQKNAKIVD